MSRNKSNNIKAVIMAAGKSTRTYPLTVTKPKPLLKIANKTLLEHQVKALSGLVNEIIIVIGYKQEMIKEFVEIILKKKYQSLTFTFIEQKEQLGTGHVLTILEDKISDVDEKFLIINGDDIFVKEDFEALLKEESGFLVYNVDDVTPYGAVIADTKNNFISIHEKPSKPKSGLVNCGAYLFTRDVFKFKNEVKKSPRGEYEIVDFLVLLAKSKKVNVLKVVRASAWFPISFSWSLLDVNSHFLEQLSQNNISNEAVIEKKVTLKGNIVVGKGTLLKSGTYIEGNVIIGENCTIGPNCYIRGPTSIDDNSKVGNAVEIKGSILGNKAVVGHLSYVGDSVIGDNVNLGAGTITANLRHDHNNIKSEIKGSLIETGRRKLGTIMGDGVHTGIHTSINPGRKLWPNTTTIAGQVVTADIKGEI